MINQKSILELMDGGLMEMVDVELRRVMENINDENTRPDKAREISVKIKLTPNVNRDEISIQYDVGSKIVPIEAHGTRIARTTDYNGEVQYVEYVKQTPGQLALEEVEQTQPAILRVIGG